MREMSYQQFAIVEADSSTILSEKLNRALFELRDKEPTVTFEGKTARICYVERIEKPEDLTDEYRLKGVHITCSRCPFFEPVMKTDGTPDERVKRGKCPCAKYGIAYSDGQVCESFFEMLNNGGFELCLKKSE